MGNLFGIVTDFFILDNVTTASGSRGITRVCRQPSRVVDNDAAAR